MADLALTPDVARDLVARAMGCDRMRTLVLESMAERAKRFGFIEYSDGRIRAAVLGDEFLNEFLRANEAAFRERAQTMIDAIGEARDGGHYPFMVRAGGRIMVVAAFVRPLSPPAGVTFTSPGGDA